nr:hypothetical protein [Tanacetum cinerariifolium]
MAPKRTTRSTQVPPITPAPTATTITVTEAQLQALINQGVAAAMVKAEASRVRNGYDINGSGPRLAQAVRECTYPDFLKSTAQQLVKLNMLLVPCKESLLHGGTPMLKVRLITKENLMTPPGTTISNQTRDKTLKELMLQGMVTGDHTKGLDLCVPNVTITMMVLMLPNATSATDLVIYLVTTELPQMSTLGLIRWVGNAKAQTMVYAVGKAEANPYNNVVTGTFLLNNRYASILFDTGVDRSFVSTTFSSQIDIAPIDLDHHYNVEIANGRIIGLNTIMRDCTLNFLNHPFNIDLVCILFGNEILTIRGEGSNERNESRLNIISCSKAQEYMSKGCHVFLANITSTKDEDKSKGKRLEDVPVIREFPEESDIGDCDNTGDGSKTAGKAIITWGGEIALCACMASIYGSSCKGEKISMSKRYLVKSFEELGELFLGIVGKDGRIARWRLVSGVLVRGYLRDKMRLSTTFKPKELTFQVALDILSLKSFYQAFLISASVPAIYMHEFWATVSYHKHYIKFKMNKKNYSFDLETFRDMLQICPNLLDQNFVDPSFEEEILAFMRELGYPGNIKSLSDVKVEILPQPGRTFGTIDNKCLGEKTVQAPKASPSKRLKATAKVAKSGKKKLRAKGLETLSEVTLSKAEQVQIAIKRSKTQFHRSQAHGSDEHEGTGIIPGVLDTESDNDGDDFVHPKLSTFNEEERQDEEDKEAAGSDLREEKLDEEKKNEEEVNELYNDVNIDLEGINTKMADALLANIQATQVIEDTHVIMTAVTPEVQHQSSSISSVTTNDEIPPLSITTLPPPPIPLIHPLQQTPIFTPTTAPTTSQQNLPTFGSLFKFNDRVKDLEDNSSKFKKTNLFVEIVSLILDIVDTDEAQAENKDPIYKLDENIKKIIKEQVIVQVKEQVSKILPRIEKLVNKQLKAEVLTHLSHEAKTSYAKTLYKALIDAYETDKVILETYGDIVTFKQRRDDEDEYEEPSAGSNRGSKRRRARKEPELKSAPKEKTSKSTGSYKEGSKSKTRSTDKSAQAKEEVHTVKYLEEPARQEFEIARPPTPYRDWNKTFPAVHGPIQPWISTLARKEDPRDSFNKLMDTPLDFSVLSHKHNVESSADCLRQTCTLGISYWGQKRQQFDGYAIKKESARNVYSRNRIIAIKKLTIVEWHNYKHLEWITVRRDDDKLYTFKEGDYNRLRLQDIEDMLILLV